MQNSSLWAGRTCSYSDGEWLSLAWPHLCIWYLVLFIHLWNQGENVCLQALRGLTVWLSSSDGRHVPSRWAKSWHWHKGEKQQSQEVKNGGIREIHHHPSSLTLCRAWPYQAAGLSEWGNQVVGRAARPALVWEQHMYLCSWCMCIKSAFKIGHFTSLLYSAFNRWRREAGKLRYEIQGRIRGYWLLIYFASNYMLNKTTGPAQNNLKMD